VDGKKSGPGIFRMENGTIIQGTFENDEFVGTATINYPNGDLYEGGYEGGEKNGHGVYRTSLLEYEGDFLNGYFHGHGKLIDKIRDITTEGEFWGHLPHGQCSVLGADGKSIYTGRMEKGKRTGEGEGWGRDWHYTGEWIDGEFEGKGVLVGTWPKKRKSISGLQSNRSHHHVPDEKNWRFEGNFSKGKKEIVPNKLIIYPFKEEIVPPVQEPAAGDKNSKTDLKKGLAPAQSKDNLSSTPIIKPVVPAHHAIGTHPSLMGHPEGSIRKTEPIPPGEVKLNAGLPNSVMNISLQVVYQGPAYPDPNPPPPDPKKKPPPAKKPVPGAPPEVPEIPMITPPPILITQECNRKFKVELIQPNPDPTKHHLTFKVDYRKELKEVETLLKEKHEIEQQQKEVHDKEVKDKEAGKEPSAKEKQELRESRRSILVKKSTMTFIDESALQMYNPDTHEDEKPLYVYTSKGGLEILGLRYPENFPGGNYKIVITDTTPAAKNFVENLGVTEIPITIIPKEVVDSPQPNLKKKPLAPRKK